MSEGITINMTIVKKGDEVIIAVLPKTKADGAYENLPPFTASGTPEEAEKQLIEAIMKPIQDFSTSVTGVEEFNKAKKEADTKTAAAKEAKKKDEKKETPKKEEKKSGNKSKTKAGDKKSTADASTEEKPAEDKVQEPAKDPNVTKIEELLAEGKVAVNMKRGITAKSIRAKIANVLTEAPEIKETPLNDLVNEFVASVGVLTGEVDMFAETAPKAEEPKNEQ